MKIYSHQLIKIHMWTTWEKKDQWEEASNNLCCWVWVLHRWQDLSFLICYFLVLLIWNLERQEIIEKISLDKRDRAAVVRVTEMSPLFPPAPPHLLSVLGCNCWNLQQASAIKLLNSLLLNLENEQSYTRDMRIYKDEIEAQNYLIFF